MNNKYNVMITYQGAGTFKFSIRKIGEVEIEKGRPVYIYNADVDTINNLRALRRMLIDIKIGAKPTGAFRIFNMDDYVSAKTAQVRDRVGNNYKAEPISNAEISSILKSGNSPVEEINVPATPTVEKPKRTRKSNKK